MCLKYEPSSEQVCSQPTGASDFIAIAKAFHTVILHNVPFLNMERLPEVLSHRMYI